MNYYTHITATNGQPTIDERAEAERVLELAGPTTEDEAWAALEAYEAKKTEEEGLPYGLLEAIADGGTIVAEGSDFV